MRVTNGMLTGAVIRNIERRLEGIDRRQRQVASGKRLEKPSDDPQDVRAAMELHSDLRGIEQYVKNIENGVSWLQFTESAIGDLEGLLTEARTLAVQGANGTLSESDRQNLAQQANQILESLVSVANRQFQDKYLFGGTRTKNLPYRVQRNGGGEITQVISDQLAGSLEREIDKYTRVGINVTGEALFGANGETFQALLTLRDGLRESNIEQISRAMDLIDESFERSGQLRTEIGAKVNRLESAKEALSTQQLTLSEVLSQLEDVDVVEAILRLQEEEVAYQVTLATGAKVIQPSLVNYLG